MSESVTVETSMISSFFSATSVAHYTQAAHLLHYFYHTNSSSVVILLFRCETFFVYYVRDNICSIWRVR